MPGRKCRNSVLLKSNLFCLIGSGLTAVYFLLMVNRVFFGRLTPQLEQIPRSTWPERFPAMVLALIIISIGIIPQWFIQWSEPQAAALLLGNQNLAMIEVEQVLAMPAIAP